MELIKRLLGEGKVLDGAQEIRETGYSLSVYREFIEGRTSSGPYRIPGHIQTIGVVDASIPIGEEYTLLTAEGYRVRFWVQDTRGTFVQSGPFVDADGKPVF